MRRLLVPVVAAVPLLAAAATAWGAPPGPAKPIGGSVQFGFAPGNPPVPPAEAAAIEDKIYPANGGPAMTELTAPLPITAGGTVTFNLDGLHQPLVYRLHNGETVADAIATLQAEPTRRSRTRTAWERRHAGGWRARIPSSLRRRAPPGPR